MITEITDVQLEPSEELRLVNNWWAADSVARIDLQRAIADLPAAALADEDIREHLQSRLRALEQSQARWLAFATSSFERRVAHAIGAETRTIMRIPCPQ